ncbi:unnamed protein product [Ectocarpus fasciculatus]
MSCTRQGENACSFTVARTWAAEDLNGNSVQAERTYQVSDTEPPILSGLPADASCSKPMI